MKRSIIFITLIFICMVLPFFIGYFMSLYDSVIKLFTDDFGAIGYWATGWMGISIISCMIMIFYSFWAFIKYLINIYFIKK